MNTATIVRFIKKYHLNGLINSVVWKKYGENIQVSAMSPNKEIFVTVTLKDVAGLENGDMGISDTKPLLKSLCAFSSEEVSPSIEKHPSGEVAALTFSAAGRVVRYVTQSLDEFDSIPPAINSHAGNVAIVLDESFKRVFIKAHRAFKNDPDLLFTIVMSKRTGKLNVVFNYREKCLSDSISIQVSCVDGMDTINDPISFSVRFLKEVLKGNPEFKDPILYVSDDGLASITFSDNDLEAQYHLVKMETEE
ncbi:MAG: hypothetical protein ABSH15_08520 [Verrucomicrobiota bacterium]|jgi:hypothetical protein